MITYYVMTRTGRFRPLENTDNQCKGWGHSEYHYTLKLLFDGSAKLNDKSFLIDHQDLDDAIQDIELVGSCEQMHKQINEKLVPLLARKNLPLLVCKCVIRPTLDARPPAVLEFISLKSPEFAACLPLV